MASLAERRSARSDHRLPLSVSPGAVSDSASRDQGRTPRDPCRRTRRQRERLRFRRRSAGASHRHVPAVAAARSGCGKTRSCARRGQCAIEGCHYRPSEAEAHRSQSAPLAAQATCRAEIPLRRRWWHQSDRCGHLAEAVAGERPRCVPAVRGDRDVRRGEVLRRCVQRNGRA